MKLTPKLGMRVAPKGVKNAKTMSGVIVRVVEPEGEHHGTIFVWQEHRLDYGADNCEHYAYYDDEQLGSVLKELR